MDCQVMTCVRRMRGPKERKNYQIEEYCPYAQKGLCKYKRNESKEELSGRPETVGTAGNTKK